MTRGPYDSYALVGTALTFRGTPYRNGGGDPSGFDCSGFTQYIYAQFGVSLPRAVREQYRLGQSVGPEELEPGDLIFFSTTAPGASHVGIASCSHWQTSPRSYLKQTCLTSACHPKLTEAQANYEIDSVRNFTKGKMRKAEFWLSALIDKIVEGKKAGLPPEVIREAQEQHQKAHVLWEWWTAENSDGFHNPALARESLTRSVEESRKGIKLINDAFEKKTASK